MSLVYFDDGSSAECDLPLDILYFFHRAVKDGHVEECTIWLRVMGKRVKMPVKLLCPSRTFAGLIVDPDDTEKIDTQPEPPEAA